MSNAVGNLGLTGAYGDALKSLGFDLESVAGQVSGLIHRDFYLY